MEWENQPTPNISWSPDDKSVVFPTVVFPAEDEIRTISLVDGSKGILRNRVIGDSRMVWENLIWNPDGKSFVLYEVQSINAEWGTARPIGLTISSIDNGGGTDIVLPQKIVFTSPVPSPALCWSPDGKRVGCSFNSGFKSARMVEYWSSDVMVWDAQSGKLLFARNKSINFDFTVSSLFDNRFVYPADISLHPGLEKYAEGENYRLPFWGREIFSVVRIVRMPLPAPVVGR